MNPESFPLGSPASRAAAREELERRLRNEFAEATIVVLTGLPSPVDGPPVTSEPDFVEYRVAPDGSIVEATHRFWEGEGRTGLSIFLNQTWPDGRLYKGESCIEDISEFKELPPLTPDQIERYRRQAL